MGASQGSSSQPPSPSAQLNLSLVFQCLVSGFLLDFFASPPHPTPRAAQEWAHATETARTTSTSCLHFPFVSFLDLLTPSCLGDLEPPFCFPRPGRPPEGPSPRGEAEAEKRLFGILAPKDVAAASALVLSN